MNTTKITVIVFDLGNVLLPFNYKVAINKLNKIESGLGEKFITFYNDNYQFHRSFEKGELAETDFINKMLAALNNKISVAQFCEIYSNIFKENKDITALLPNLKKNFTLVLLSNTNSIHKKYGWKDYPFLKNFDKLILSHEVKSVKPEKEIYNCVEKYTKEPAKQHLFIDDIAEYCETAKNLGWDAIHFTGNLPLIHELKTKKIL